MKALPTVIQCPSVGSVSTFTHEDCTGPNCTWWENGCSARTLTEGQYAKHMVLLGPECPLASRCRWHVEAVVEGKPACAIRRLGMLCEHQGGVWNTFEMADPDEWEENDG